MGLMARVPVISPHVSDSFALPRGRVARGVLVRRDGHTELHGTLAYTVQGTV